MGIKRLFNKMFCHKSNLAEQMNRDITDADVNKSVEYNTISFRPGFELTELPIVSLYQGEHFFTFLLDTGSNDSIIDSNILDKIEHTMTEEKSELYGMEGNSREVHKCNITFSCNGTEFPYIYLINDMSLPFSRIKAETGVTLHGIIGSKFFNKYKYVLDFDKLIAYSKKKC